MNEKDLKHIKETDTALRQAIGRREQKRIQMPRGLNEKVMQQAAQPRRRSFRWLSIAASIVAVCLLGYTLFINDHSSELQEPVIAQNESKKAENVTAASTTVHEEPESKVIEEKTTEYKPENYLIAKAEPKQQETPTVEKAEEVQTVVTPEEDIAIYIPTEDAEPAAQYASVAVEEDSIGKAPAMMDEFIEKMAAYCRAENAEMDCLRSNDSTNMSRIYVFDERQDHKVLDRLLQMALWYDNKTPGYFLSFSQMQFVFQLQDSRLGLKYLWLAERIDASRILLYSTHTPLGAQFNTSCYLDYRNKTTNTIERAL